MKTNPKSINHSKKENNKPDLRLVTNASDFPVRKSPIFYVLFSAGMMGVLFLFAMSVRSGQKLPTQSVNLAGASLANLSYAGESCNKNSDCMSDWCASAGDFNLNGRLTKTCRSWFLE